MSEVKKKQLLYMQLRDSILADYKDKPYYSPLPGERELCDIYSVSRPTVRKALEILEDERCIIRLTGKGAFFIGNKEFVDANNDMRFSDIAFYNQVSLRGDYTSSKVLLQKIEIADKEVAVMLRLPKNAKVFHLERLRYINGKLYSLANAYIPYELCPELTEYDFSDRSLHNTLCQYGHVPFKADKTIEISKASEYDAMHLDLKPGDPISISSTVTYDEQGNMLEYAVTRADAYKTLIQMQVYNQDHVKDKVMREKRQ